MARKRALKLDKDDLARLERIAHGGGIAVPVEAEELFALIVEVRRQAIQLPSAWPNGDDSNRRCTFDHGRASATRSGMIAK